MTPSTETIRLPFPVPYYAQVASPDLAAEFFEAGRPLESDPRWAESGAASPAEYAYWADRACGIACVKMCVEALGGPVRPMMAWVEAGLALNGYAVNHTRTGETEEIGWVHRSLADLVLPYAGRAWPQAASLEEVIKHLRAGRLVIASVSYQIGTTQPVTRRGGHLVVLTGAQLADGDVRALIAHNPSGRTPELRVHARIPADRFLAAYAGRVIVIEPRSAGQLAA
ncbi:MAG TPA: C39 family peptidase [Anaerolineaceae bacterium]|nr:C39 family peptidase [Anaerolineaceae bacterium]